ncbi:winged helix-turn-helix transcriptional regulator [Streptomyces sp. NPDC050161]|uniref:winged helix-turn-helix transcriptional regulator n=1 Tax=Streptomyces sp. NPDC050161 TaxID=3365604 RepID=UPI003788E352
MDDARIRPRPGSPGAGPSTKRGAHADRDNRMGMDRIADQWSGMVIMVLADGTKRYAELRAALTGVSENCPYDGGMTVWA